MPVEIRELEIKGNVQNGDLEHSINQKDARVSKAEREAIIAECIERMLELLDKKGGR